MRFDEVEPLRAMAVLAVYLAGLCDYGDKLAKGKKGGLAMLLATRRASSIVSTFAGPRQLGFHGGIDIAIRGSVRHWPHDLDGWHRPSSEPFTLSG